MKSGDMLFSFCNNQYTSSMQEKDFKKVDYTTLANGINWLGRPLGWKSIAFTTIIFYTVTAVYYFFIPMKRSHLTMYENYGIDAAFPIALIILIFLLFIYSLSIDYNENYIAGKKYIFTGRISSYKKDDSGYYTDIILEANPMGPEALKLNHRIIKTTLKPGIVYEFEVTPKSRIILSLKIINMVL